MMFWYVVGGFFVLDFLALSGKLDKLYDVKLVATMFMWLIFWPLFLGVVFGQVFEDTEKIRKGLSK